MNGMSLPVSDCSVWVDMNAPRGLLQISGQALDKERISTLG